MYLFLFQIVLDLKKKKMFFINNFPKIQVSLVGLPISYFSKKTGAQKNTENTILTL